jgi:hypothetical protein
MERELARHPTLAGRMARMIKKLGHLLDDGRERRLPEAEPSALSAPTAPSTDGLTDQAWPKQKSDDAFKARGTAADS